MFKFSLNVMFKIYPIINSICEYNLVSIQLIEKINGIKTIVVIKIQGRSAS